MSDEISAGSVAANKLQELDASSQGDLQFKENYATNVSDLEASRELPINSTVKSRQEFDIRPAHDIVSLPSDDEDDNTREESSKNASFYTSLVPQLQPICSIDAWQGVAFSDNPIFTPRFCEIRPLLSVIIWTVAQIVAFSVAIHTSLQSDGDIMTWENTAKRWKFWLSTCVLSFSGIHSVGRVFTHFIKYCSSTTRNKIKFPLIDPILPIFHPRFSHLIWSCFVWSSFNRNLRLEISEGIPFFLFLKAVVNTNVSANLLALISHSLIISLRIWSYRPRLNKIKSLAWRICLVHRLVLENNYSFSKSEVNTKNKSKGYSWHLKYPKLSKCCQQLRKKMRLCRRYLTSFLMTYRSSRLLLHVDTSSLGYSKGQPKGELSKSTFSCSFAQKTTSCLQGALPDSQRSCLLTRSMDLFNVLRKNAFPEKLEESKNLGSTVSSEYFRKTFAPHSNESELTFTKIPVENLRSRLSFGDIILLQRELCQGSSESLSLTSVSVWHFSRMLLQLMKDLEAQNTEEELLEKSTNIFSSRLNAVVYFFVGSIFLSKLCSYRVISLDPGAMVGIVLTVALLLSVIFQIVNPFVFLISPPACALGEQAVIQKLPSMGQLRVSELNEQSVTFEKYPSSLGQTIRLSHIQLWGKKGAVNTDRLTVSAGENFMGIQDGKSCVGSSRSLSSSVPFISSKIKMSAPLESPLSGTFTVLLPPLQQWLQDSQEAFSSSGFVAGASPVSIELMDMWARRGRQLSDEIHLAMEEVDGADLPYLECEEVFLCGSALVRQNK
eukprot:GHVP01027074.1.p1 GENE.GHVP01027074.1~~GHVP01027074.1.p1  ORF type:complete len:778 (-),score=122.77 GHVP01027074.1:996-3329(-)